MRVPSWWCFPIAVCTVIAWVGTATATMSSQNFTLTSSTMDTNGQRKSSPTFQLLDVTGQSTTIGTSRSATYILNAGFIGTTGFTSSLDAVLTNIINALTKLLGDLQTLRGQATTKSERLAIDQQIRFIENAIDAAQKALMAFSDFQAGQPAALANALNQADRAIRNMMDFQSATTLNFNTAPYQKMLAEAAQLNVTTEINRIGGIVGPNNPSIGSAKAWLIKGSGELLATLYADAVGSFRKAYNDALGAL